MWSHFVCVPHFVSETVTTVEVPMAVRPRALAVNDQGLVYGCTDTAVYQYEIEANKVLLLIICFVIRHCWSGLSDV